MKFNPLVIAFIAGQAVAAVWYAVSGDWARAWYFISGASITASVLFMR
jgi:hypothetical protein